MVPGTFTSQRLRFPKGSTSASVRSAVGKGRHAEYVLHAREGQTMNVALQSDDSDLSFRIFLRNGDISGKRRSWSGMLPRTGDYHVLVYQRSDAAGGKDVPFTLTVGIE